MADKTRWSCDEFPRHRVWFPPWNPKPPAHYPRTPDGAGGFHSLEFLKEPASDTPLSGALRVWVLPSRVLRRKVFALAKATVRY
jgi:hypothetical protein